MTGPTPACLARADTTTGIPSDCLYRLPEGFLRAMAIWELDRDALRLLYVLVHQSCRDCQDWSGGRDLQPDEGYGLTLRDVHRRQGTRPDRGNGAILEAAATLRATGAFDRIEPRHGNRTARWRFTEDAYTLLFAHDRFGYLDVRALPHLRDALSLTLLGEIALVRGMRAPKLKLTVEGLHRLHGLAGFPCWKSVSRPLLAALGTIGALHGLRLVVGLAWHHRLAGIDTIDLRLEHTRTVWRTGVLGRVDHRMREVVVIGPDGVHRMRPDALPGYFEARQRMST